MREGEFKELLLQKIIRIFTGILRKKFLFLLIFSNVINSFALSQVKTEELSKENFSGRNDHMTGLNFFESHENQKHKLEEFIEKSSAGNIALKRKKEFIKYRESLNSKKNLSDFSDMLDAGYKAGYLREIEELYSTNSFYQNLNISKRFNQYFRAAINAGLEYSKRQEVEVSDVNRWYDNTGFNSEIDFNQYNSVLLFVSGSISDTTLTSYGFTYNAVIQPDEFQVNNTLTASYDYFYYWNQVAQNFVSDNIELSYRDFSFDASYFFGVVDFNYVDGYEEKARNPNTSLNLQLTYNFWDKPSMNVGMNFNTRNFKYYSPLYFSPQDRMIGGISYSLFNSFDKVYVYFGSGASMDNNDLFIWSIDGEVGYDSGDFSLSGGISRYNDPYYTSYNTFLNISKSF